MSVHSGRSQRPLYSARKTFHHLQTQTSIPPSTSTTFETIALVSLFGIILGVILVVIGILNNQHYISYLGFCDMFLIILWFSYYFTCRS